MTENEKNDLFYLCSLIEYTGRYTKNRRGNIVAKLGADGIKRNFRDAEVNHCLSMQQVCDELIEMYQVDMGDFDTITSCKYQIPAVTDIGRLYCQIILDCAKNGDELQELERVFSSFISDAISDFGTDLYYQNPSYLEASYREGTLLE